MLEVLLALQNHSDIQQIIIGKKSVKEFNGHGCVVVGDPANFTITCMLNFLFGT